MRVGSTFIAVCVLIAVHSAISAATDAMTRVNRNDPLCELGLEAVRPVKTITVAKPGGRAELQGDDESRYLAFGRNAERTAEYMFNIAKEGMDPEKAWAQSHPYGIHYLTSDVPSPELTRDQKQELMRGERNMRAKTEQPTWMLDRTTANLISTEARFLKENTSRREGLALTVERLERQNKKQSRQENYKDQIVELDAQNIQLEESILAKYAEYVEAPVRAEHFGMVTPKQDLQAIANAAYQAALHRAQRLGIPHREIVLSKGVKAIEFLAEDTGDIGKLVRSVHSMTGKDGKPFKVVFAPELALEARHMTGNMFIAMHDMGGLFGISPQYLLFGKRDLLVTPMQLRGLQTHMMRQSGTPTPFRGQVTQDASTVVMPYWQGMDQTIVIGAYLKNFSKALKDQTPEIKDAMARELHDALQPGRDLLFISGASLADRAASRSIEKLSDPNFNGVEALSTGEGMMIGILDPDKPGKYLTTITFLDGPRQPQAILHSPYARFDMPLNGKDVKVPYQELVKIMKKHAVPEGDDKFTPSQADRENVVRILRAIQRTADVGMNLTDVLSSQTDKIKEAAAKFVESPSTENESDLHAAIADYKEPKLERLSLRGLIPEEPTPPEILVDTVKPIEGPKTPDYLVDALKTGRGIGTMSAPYRKAIEQISISAVRTILEQHGMDTKDRGNDLLGYDVFVTPRSPDQLREIFVEVKGTSDVNGMVSFTPAEIQFARNHFSNGDWVLAIAIVDDAGNTKIYFRRGIDLGNPLPPGIDKRPFLIHDLMSMGVEAAPTITTPPPGIPSPSSP